MSALERLEAWLGKAYFNQVTGGNKSEREGVFRFEVMVSGETFRATAPTLAEAINKALDAAEAQ